MIIDLAESNLAFTVMFIFVIGYILGMGLSVIPAYVILATLAAPALIQLGIPVMAAHLLVLWWGQASNVTPPVALAAYMAAGISKQRLWPVCNVAMVKAMAIFYLPVLFVYQPGLLLQGSVWSIVITIASLALGGLAISAGIEGFLLCSALACRTGALDRDRHRAGTDPRGLRADPGGLFRRIHGLAVPQAQGRRYSGRRLSAAAVSAHRPGCYCGKREFEQGRPKDAQSHRDNPRLGGGAGIRAGGSGAEVSSSEPARPAAATS